MSNSPSEPFLGERNTEVAKVTTEICNTLCPVTSIKLSGGHGSCGCARFYTFSAGFENYTERDAGPRHLSLNSLVRGTAICDRAK